jgi:phage terminase large subunit GpA-like protein
VWVNTYLGETWSDEGSGDGLDDYDIATHREDYNYKVPQDVVLLTCGADVQSDRIECELLGHAKDSETFSIDFQIFYGDPNSSAVWAEFDEYLSMTWEREDGVELTIKGTCVDSGGHHTQSVYRFCKPRLGKRVFAIKGVGGEGKPLVNGKPSTNNNLKCKLWMIGVDTAKEIIYSNLRIKEVGAGYCHFPSRYSDEYFKQLTAEKVVKKYHKGFHRREWIKVRARNEALDCRVYALAALSILGVSVNMLAQKSAKADVKDADIDKPHPIQRTAKRRTSGFVNGWR